MSDHDLVIRGGHLISGTRAWRGAGTDITIGAGVIRAIGRVSGRGHREIDADGLLVTPGWVDIHTHYDGQVTWDPEVSPSSWHGVTTVVMGNCGVGFGPVRKGVEDFLIELMEGVEDIPGTALHEGIDWRWESFAEYLDALEAMPRVLDVAAQVPHTAIRAYVMGERAHEPATPEEIAEMADLVQGALEAGAIGFSTSRTILHKSVHGYIPGTTAPHDELLAIADAIGRAGHGVFDAISDQLQMGGDEEWAFLREFARRSGDTVTFSLAQAPQSPEAWKSALAHAAADNAAGLPIAPQVSSRPVGMLFGLQSSLHPFITHPTYRAMADRPLAERVARLRDPQVRAQLLAEEPRTRDVVATVLMTRWDDFFPLGDPPDYEPHPSTSAAATAQREGRRPQEVVLDWLLEDDGKAFLFAPLASYVDKDHEALRTMMTHPSTVVGLPDGGAPAGSSATRR